MTIYNYRPCPSGFSPCPALGLALLVCAVLLQGQDGLVPLAPVDVEHGVLPHAPAHRQRDLVGQALQGVVQGPWRASHFRSSTSDLNRAAPPKSARAGPALITCDSPSLLCSMVR